MRRQARDRQVTEGLATSARRLAGSQLAVNVGTTLLTWLLLRVARPGDIALIPLAALLGGIVGVVVRMGTGTQLIRMVPRIQADSHGDRRVEDVAGAALRAGVLGGMVLLPLGVVGGWWLHANILEGEPWSVILALLGTAAVVGYSRTARSGYRPPGSTSSWRLRTRSRVWLSNWRAWDSTCSSGRTAYSGALSWAG